MPEWKIANFELPSEANLSEHWSKKHKRHQLYKAKLLQIKRDIINAKLPIEITLTRIAPRMLDEDDNLPMAFKKIKDILADWIIPGLAPGRADGDRRLKWLFKQEKGLPKEKAIKITIKEL